MIREVRERRPTSREWREIPVPREFYRGRHAVMLPIAASAWRRGSVSVMSELVIAELPGGTGENGPQWCASVSRSGGKRPRPRDVEHFLRDFGLDGAEEDNHMPGGARHFWLPVDPARRGVCECKTTEDVITDRDGYQWTNPTETALDGCRGCEFEALLGRPCPIHSHRPRRVT